MEVDKQLNWLTLFLSSSSLMNRWHEEGIKFEGYILLRFNQHNTSKSSMHVYLANEL